jgi:indole-3-glycerol phosphate synthase
MSVLTEIVARKRVRVDAARKAVPLGKVREQAVEARRIFERHRLLSALQRDRLNVIAEFKRRSPSKGVIRTNADVGAIVRAYAAGGAAAVSVLTEADHFDGSLDDLRAAKSAIDLPVLRKDFLFDEYQIFEAAAAGADAILLIVSVLDHESLPRLRKLAEDELGIDAVVEVHDEEEMERALAAGARLIGVNNRNLHTFEVTLQTSVDLATKAAFGSILISESGLKTADDLSMLRGAGYRGFLIGESLMHAENPAEALRNLIGEGKSAAK